MWDFLRNRPGCFVHVSVMKPEARVFHFLTFCLVFYYSPNLSTDLHQMAEASHQNSNSSFHPDGFPCDLPPLSPASLISISDYHFELRGWPKSKHISRREALFKVRSLLINLIVSQTFNAILQSVITSHLLQVICCTSLSLQYAKPRTPISWHLCFSTFFGDCRRQC